jgi:hypothetical protein
MDGITVTPDMVEACLDEIEQHSDLKLKRFYGRKKQETTFTTISSNTPLSSLATTLQLPISQSLPSTLTSVSVTGPIVTNTNPSKVIPFPIPSSLGLTDKKPVITTATTTPSTSTVQILSSN